VPLLNSICDICKSEGTHINLSPPGDIRFCSHYEREVLKGLLLTAFGCDPIGDRIVLLNKTTGDDRTDEVIVDGLHFGILRFDMRGLGYVFDLSVDGAKILAAHTINKTVELKKASSHLSGKKVKADQLLNFTADIKKQDTVLIKCKSLIGFGVSLSDHEHFKNSEDAVLRVRKLDGNPVSLNPHISSVQDVIKANTSHMEKISRDAANVIKGIVNRKEYKDLPVHVSFSGGRIALWCLILPAVLLKKDLLRLFSLILVLNSLKPWNSHGIFVQVVVSS
jgi:phosphoadenosine phosphosulfate reductase